MDDRDTAMTRVGFGTTVLARGINGGGIDGIGTYTYELGRAVREQTLASLTPVTFGTPMPENLLPGSGKAFELPRYGAQAALAGALGRPFRGITELERQIDVFHATDHLVPKLRHTPVLATVMDSIPLTHPEWLGSPSARLKARLWRRLTRRAEHIVTISEHSRVEIATHFDLPNERITAIPLGVPSRFFAAVDLSERNHVLAQYGLPSQFVIAVGTLQPRKNIDRLIDAHQGLSANIRREMPLVVIGRAGWACETTIARLRHLSSRREAVWLSHVPDTSLRALMQSATMMVFPSLSEGFGLPALEAFASGLPLIASNRTAIPEVTGEAALLVDTTEVEAIRAAMNKLIEDASLREKLAKAGLERAKQFTWEATARETAELYKRLAS